MVPEWSYREYLVGPSAHLTVRWLPTGGHVGYPAHIDLGEPGETGVEAQLIAWLSRQ